MTNLLGKGWNFDDNWHTIQILSLTLFIFCFLTTILLFVCLFFYRKTLKNFCHSLEEMEKIARYPIPNQLNHLVDILLITPNTEKFESLKIWQLEYKIIIDNKFLEQAKIVNAYFDSYKQNLFSLHWYKQSKFCLQELTLTVQRLHELQQEIRQLFAWEVVQRNTRIKIRELFNQLKKDILYRLSENNHYFDLSKLIKEFETVDTALTMINQKIFEGRYERAAVLQNKTNEFIVKLIKLVDFSDQTKQALSTTLPTKISNLENYYVNQNKIVNQSAIGQIKDLRRRFELMKIQIETDLATLNYESAKQKLVFISQYIANFETVLNQKNQFKNFINSNFHLIEGLVSNLRKDSKLINQLVAITKSKNSFNITKKSEINSVIMQTETFLEEWDSFCVVIMDLDWGNDNLEIDVVYRNLVHLLQKLNNLYRKIVVLSKNIEPNLNLKSEVESKILALKAILTSTEVIVKKFQTSVFLTDQWQENFEQIILKVAKIESSELYIQNQLTTEFKNKIILNLDKLILDALTLKNNLKNRILLDALAEQTIIYLDRYTNSPVFAKIYEEIIKNYEDKKITDVLNTTIYYLQQFHTKKGET